MKNILKAKRRTILTFIILSFGIMMYLMLGAMMEGFDKTSVKNFIDFESGHFKIRNKTFDEDKPYNTDNFLKKTDIIEAQLKKMDFIEAYTKRILFLATADNYKDTIPVITIGIDPVNDPKVFTIKKFIEKGKLTEDGAVIGKALAKDMKLGIGDNVNISFRSSKGMNVSLELLITGLINTADPKVNNATIYINIKKAKEYMDIEGVTAITIKTKDFKKTSDYEKILGKKITTAQVWNWQTLSSDFSALMKTKKQSSNFILFFITIIAVVGIVNTILMSVYEKRQEIGTLMAMGMTEKEVRNIFIFEGLTIGLLGSIIGMIAGTLVNLYFIYVGIDFTAMMGGADSMGMNVMGHVKSMWMPSQYFTAFFLAVISSVLASYYPAKKVMKMSPVECLRTVQ